MKKTLYQVLGVEAAATQEEIAAGYARCAQAFEAGAYDRNAQVIAKEALAILSDPTRRAHYDRSLKEGPAAPRRVLREDDVYEDRPGRSRTGVLGLAVSVGVAVGMFAIWKAGHVRPAPVVAVPPALVRQTMDAAEAAVHQANQANQASQATAPAALGAGTGGELSSEELFARLAPGIVRIDATTPGRSGAIGSGVVIAPRTVITNCHVAQAGDQLRVKSGGNSYEGRLVLADEAHDLCKLEVSGMPANPLPIGRSHALRTGQKVVALGAPHGLDLTISEGIVSSLRQVDDGTLIQTTAPTSPGSSGGGLFDMHGNLVGIVTFQATSGQNLNFAAPAEWIGSMSATRGNGIISKLDGARRTDSDPALTNFPGRWSCHDSIRGIALRLDVDPGGRLEYWRGNKSLPGMWRLVSKRIEVDLRNDLVLQVEYLSAEKLIINVGEGIRHVCGRV